MKKIVLKLINFYQTKITIYTPKACKYLPTCSQYAKECYTEYNFIYASLLTVWRLLRCNPFSKGGYDPIPKVKKKLKEESYSDSSSFK
ncbi:MAG: membrane protein insertion efficiency factor YidD [bacterium]